MRRHAAISQQVPDAVPIAGDPDVLDIVVAQYGQTIGVSSGGKNVSRFFIVADDGIAVPSDETQT